MGEWINEISKWMNARNNEWMREWRKERRRDGGIESERGREELERERERRRMEERKK